MYPDAIESERANGKQRGKRSAPARYVVSDVEVETAWRASAADEEAAWRAPKALHSNADEVTPVCSCDEVDLSQVTVSEGGVGKAHTSTRMAVDRVEKSTVRFSKKKTALSEYLREPGLL